MMRTSLLSALRPHIPHTLLGLLLLLHLALAARTHINNGFIPGEIMHSGYHLVVNISRILQGYEYDNTMMNSFAGETSFFGPPKALPWSDPRFFWQELSQGRLAHLWRNSLSADSWTEWPHHIFLAALVHLISGGSVLATAMTSQIYVVILLLSVFGIGRMVRDRWTGLAAALIASGYPGIFAIGRTHHDSLPVAALATAVVYLLLKSEGFSRIGPSALAGLVAFFLSRSGESTSMTVLGGLICSGPFLWALWRSPIWRRPRIYLLPIAGLLLFLGQIMIIVLLDWQRLHNFIFDYAPQGVTNTESFAVVHSHIQKNIAEILPYLAYPVEFTVRLLKPLMTLWLLLGAALLWRAPAGLRLALTLMVAIPLLSLSWMPKKATWYVIPLLPALALITTHGLLGLRSLRARTAALCLASLSGLFMLVGTAMAPALTSRVLDPAGLSTVVRKAVRIPYLNHLWVGPPDPSVASPGLKVIVAQFLRHHEETGLDRKTSNLVVMLPRSSAGQQLRYSVELQSPDILTIVPIPESPPLEKIPEHRFRYLLFLDEYSRLVPMPKTESEIERHSRNNPKALVPFITRLTKMEWIRVDLPCGPIYQHALDFTVSLVSTAQDGTRLYKVP